jgi:putative membrane protein (TIGR04086 family)
MKAQSSQMHWGRVLLTGILVVILVVILNTVLLLLTTYVWSQPDQAQIAIQVSSWSTYMLLLLFTFGGAVWVARTGEREPLLHGFLMGLVVGLIICFFSLGSGSPVLRALLTLVLNVAAGYLGGILGSQSRTHPHDSGTMDGDGKSTQERTIQGTRHRRNSGTY